MLPTRLLPMQDGIPKRICLFDGTDGYIRSRRNPYFYFVNTEREMIEYAAKAGADRVELYTEPYATLYPRNPEAAVAPFVEAAKVTRSLGMGLNAGHDLSLVNLKYMHDNIPWLDEVSIGHALISDALYLGLKQTIEEYKNCLR